MTAKFERDGLNLTSQLLRYVRDVTVHERPALVELRERTAARPDARMMIAPEQGQALGLFVRLTGARSVVEVGSFTGYSAAWLADAVGEGGRVIACDVDAELLALAQENWKAAGVADRVEARLGPAAQTLEGLLKEGWGKRVDLMFIDADKESYPTYFEQALSLVRPGGVILFDNMLWSGRVADPSDTSATTQAIRDTNALVGRDPRVFAAMLPIGDGVLAAWVR